MSRPCGGHHPRQLSGGTSGGAGPPVKRFYQDWRKDLPFGYSCRSSTTSDGRLCPERQIRSEEHTSELQSRGDIVCRLLLEKKKTKQEYVCMEAAKCITSA